MRLKRIALAGAVLIGLLAIVACNALFFRPWSINVFFERVALSALLDSPQSLSSLRLLEPWGLRGHNARLDDASDAHAEARLEEARADLATLHGYDRASLSDGERLSYDTLEWSLQQQIDGERFRFHNFPVNQLWGEQLNLINFLSNTHQVNDGRDAEDYLSRLAAVPTKLAQIEAAQASRAARGIVAPNFALQKSVQGMQALLAEPAERNPLYTSLAEKLQATRLDADAQAALLARAKSLISSAVYPAYRRLSEATAKLAASHPRNDGAWSLPDGAAYYAWVLRGHLTTDIAPEQVHQLGLSEVARIQAEMRTILRAQGEDASDIGQAMLKLGNDPRFLYPDTPAGRAQILADYKAILAQMQAALPKAFGHLPKATIDVRPVPKVAEQTAPGAYYEPAALDGSRPGVFYANLYDIKSTTRWSMRTLAFHEGLPGHHLQGSIAQEQQGLPSFRRFSWYTAYGEGWALYAEKLGDEMGLEPDPYDKLGRLRDELFRAVRLVVDTGLHAKRWTREQAIDYMMRNTGMTENDTVIEIERYLVDPGQACAYKIGMLKILALREDARRQLGSRFDLRAFHDLVLGNGSLPLALLERSVADWIAARKG